MCTLYWITVEFVTLSYLGLRWLMRSRFGRPAPGAVRHVVEVGGWHPTPGTTPLPPVTAGSFADGAERPFVSSVIHANPDGTVMAGASRLARFNIAKNPQPSNPGRPGKKYFVGMPIPAGAGVVAAVVHYSAGVPVTSWWTAMSWLMMVVVVGYLMVSTWRFYSFKDIDFRSRRPFRWIVVIAVVVASIALFSRLALFIIAIVYMASGVLWRLQWIFHRKTPPAPPAYREASHTP